MTHKRIKSTRNIVLDPKTNLEVKGAVVISAGDIIEMADGGDLPKSVLDTISHCSAHIGHTGQVVQLVRPVLTKVIAVAKTEPDFEVVTTPSEKDLLREFLDSAGVKYHHNCGVKKLRAMVAEVENTP